jgi:hypothetical protein
MSDPDNGQPLSEDRRREIFLAQVETQDGGGAVAESRKLVAQRFGVTERQVREIERDGLKSE